ncbi:MAG: pullulanase-type alpha-1,6-glucosidase [Aestuariibacter sp.]
MFMTVKSCFRAAVFSTLALLSSPAISMDVEDLVFYFVLPDRFYNGDNNNDLGDIQGDRLAHGYDPQDSHFYHGGDLKGLKKKLPYLKQMGINAIWISPPFKNKPVIGQTAAYHGYWGTDFTQVDPHWGSNKDLRKFIKAAHKKKIKVFFDVVVNHTADVIKFEECHDSAGNLLPGLTSCAYRSKEESQSNPYTPFIPANEANSKQPEWLNDPAYYHNQGDSTFAGESSLNGDFFGLDDLNTEDPAVVQGMVDIFKFWVSEFKIDGFRVDTIKHVNAEFWQSWIPAIESHAAQQGIDDFFIFGEAFDGLPANLAQFTRTAEFPSVLDFGLYYAVKDVIADTQGTDRLAWVFSQDDYYTHPDTDARQLMNFASNHDVGRIGHFIQQRFPGISDSEALQRTKLAQSLIMLSRGIPVYYYGDEQGFTGDGGDAGAREDMLASQVASYNDNNLIGTTATTADENFDKHHPVYRHIKRLSKLYKKHDALRHGPQFTRYSESEPGLLALSRYDENRNREYLVLFNTSTTDKTYVTEAMARKYKVLWPRPENNDEDDSEEDDDSEEEEGSEEDERDLDDDESERQTRIIRATNGLLEVAVPALDVVILRSKKSLTLPETVPDIGFTSLTDGQLVSGLQELHVSLTEASSAPMPLHRVHFAMRVGDGEFQSLGTDYNSDYRVFTDLSTIPDGTVITFRATVDNYGQQSNQTEVQVVKGLAEGMTVYFEKPESWESANIYWWNASPQSGTDWPGVAMERISGNWYQFQFEDGVTAANLIFNDGAGNQSTDLFREGNGCYQNAIWSDSCDIPEPALKVYFKKPDNWSQSVNVYFWEASPTPDTGWPGELMLDEGNGWFSYQFDVGTSSANLIFNDGSNQTDNLYRDADGCYVSGSWQDSCDTSAVEPGMTVYFQRPLNWNVPNVHYWYDGGATAWPGIEMNALGDDWFSLQLPDGVQAANMVINDKTDGSNGFQTADLYREGDGCYDLSTDQWTDTCATPGFTVYFQKPVNWDTANTYYWAPQPAGPTVDWPGDSMNALGEDWFSYQFPAGITAANLIFNNAGQPQTSDLYREGDGCYTLEGGWTDSCAVPQPGMTVYFYRPDGWGTNVNVYYWNADGSPAWPGVSMQSLGDGWYSYTFPVGVDNADLIFNDGQGSQTGDLQIADGGCYGEFGDYWRKSCITPDQAEDIAISNRAAHWLRQDTIAWQVQDSRATQIRLYHSATASLAIEQGMVTGSDGFISLTNFGPLSGELTAENPHLSHLSAWQLHDLTQVEDIIKSQLAVVALDENNIPLEATYVQIPRVLDDVFQFAGHPGVSYASGVPEITVWAPTAQSLQLILTDEQGNELSRYNATATVDGAWQFIGDASWDKQYYQFEIRVYHPVSNQIETLRVSDPYAVSVSENGRLAQILDLAGDPSLKPQGWDSIVKSLPVHADISLYEGHVRDFSQSDSTVPSEQRGKYLAFTNNGVAGATMSDGMAHLSGLQQVGLTHFHLLPVFDISSVNEAANQRIDLDSLFSDLCRVSAATEVQSRCAGAANDSIRAVLEDIKSTDATSADIQAIVAEMVNLDSFNWGYDPHHFNAPEGSYASQADGISRVREFREMVKALDEIGLKVVMDVVYNHTSASGLWDNSVLDKLVPGYYQRLNPVTGAVENSTCCDNTATEHRMMKRLMVDTLVHWAKYYKIDAFRFDLMGHIPKSAMQEAQAALASLTLANDGVDGANIYLYGEGWDFGEVAGGQRFEQATQFNMAGTGIGTFNDRIRSAVRGGNFTDSGRAQGWANGNEVYPTGVASGASSLNDQADRIRIGLAGNLQSYPFVDNGGFPNTGANYAGVGYTLDPQESVNYVDKHDNETLWDNTQAKLPDSMNADDRVRVHLLSNAIINFGQGVPFYQMGTDLLRSKSLDRNSYNSGDWFNKLDFSAQSNQWGAGLPPAQDNQSRWTTMADLINNGNIQVTPAQIQQAKTLFREQLAIRYSSPLFRLDSADDVIQRVGFHNTGPGQTPGVIAMSISDGICAGTDLDSNYDGVLVLFNADDQSVTINVPHTEGSQLHPVLSQGIDDVAKATVISGDSYIVPAHTAVVLVKPQSGPQGDYPCNPQVASENQPGTTVYFKKPVHWSEVRIYFWNTTAGNQTTNWPGESMTEIGDNWYAFQFNNGVSAANIIFNNNNGEQTADLYRDSDGCYEYDGGYWSDTCVLPGLTLSFLKPLHWSDDIHIHYWNAEGIPATSWPGVAMTSLGNNEFRFEMPDGVRATSLIFNDAATGTGEQTSDLYREQNGCYRFDEGSWSQSCY